MAPWSLSIPQEDDRGAVLKKQPRYRRFFLWGRLAHMTRFADGRGAQYIVPFPENCLLCALYVQLKSTWTNERVRKD